MITEYHAKYYANVLTRRGIEGVERISQSLFDACVDLNPHQIDAALFALRNPISKGVLLADEVGLGKTIEAGLVLCQYWAERKRRLLVICPASLRKQWALELQEKFNLSVCIMDAKTFRQSENDSDHGAFDQKQVIIISMHFASHKSEEIRILPWDLVVIDEAHKLRNAYRESNRMGQNIRNALEGIKKILLTATPLQNTLLELYGLSSIIDENIFGDLPSFRTLYMNSGSNPSDLRDRLLTYCHRTLRRQVLEYVKFTERRLITQPFEPTDNEHKLYEAISEFLQRDNTYAVPHRQKHLLTLIARKLLASSPHAVASTLDTMRERLITLKDTKHDQLSLAELIIQDEDIEEEILDELLEDEGEPVDAETPKPDNNEKINFEKINTEITELNKYAQWARSIGIDSKTRSLIKALKLGFIELVKMDAAEKAVVFTESRRTQFYLKDFLEANGYAGKVITFNGANSDADSTQIYNRWCELNRDSGRASGSKVIDIRTALIEHFEKEGTILIATEAAAEGINLQFCSLVINFDLPWNPQRIEQRIGRCHRYGQKHDVVVINFLNSRNAADLRVYALLQHKFQLFSGIFGASDEVLGTVESGVDFERRILDIYQQCRTPDEIEAAFKKLQDEMDEKISQRLEDTRKALLDNFDEDVHERLRANLAGTQVHLDRFSQLFWMLTKFILKDNAIFDDDVLTFKLHNSPKDNVHIGEYHLISKQHQNITGDFLYRLSHPLGEFVLEQAKLLKTPLNEIAFNITHHPKRITMIDDLKGKSGWLLLQRLIIDSYDREEYLLFSGYGDDGTTLDQETCEKLFHCDGNLISNLSEDQAASFRLEAEANRHIHATINRSLETNNVHFQEARDQLERWAEDAVLGAEKDLKDTKEQIKALTRQARQAPTLEEQKTIQDRIRTLENKKRRQRQEIFQVEDEIMEKRDRLISELEERLSQKSEVEPLFTIRWQVV